MSQTWFISDTHFGHRNLVEKGLRRGPFRTVQEMDKVIIERWNALVQPGDTVWHLGDFTLAGAEEAIRYRKRLNGKIHLIWGNHDRNSVRGLGREVWASSQYATEVSVEGIKITLCHYAMRVWNQCHRGSLMLHGHSHGNLPGTSQSLDVGVDMWDFRPTNLEAVRALMQRLPPYRAEDHHVSPED